MPSNEEEHHTGERRADYQGLTAIVSRVETLLQVHMRHMEQFALWQKEHEIKHDHKMTLHDGSHTEINKELKDHNDKLLKIDTAWKVTVFIFGILWGALIVYINIKLK